MRLAQAAAAQSLGRGAHRVNGLSIRDSVLSRLFLGQMSPAPRLPGPDSLAPHWFSELPSSCC